MPFGIIIDPQFEAHRNPAGHPERSERIGALIQALDAADLPVQRFDPIAAGPESICRVHERRHFELIRATADATLMRLDPDTFTSPRSFEVALQAAGAGLRLLGLIREGALTSGFALVRPPGHHAERGRAMGFCLFNNVAVAAQWALDENLARRIAIVDFDGHHGNGTQEIFWDRSDVLYISSHRYPFYPGTGAMLEIGVGPGRGMTVNFPLPAETDDAFLVGLYRTAVLPLLEEYEPDLLLVSAGFDAHFRDPLVGMQMTETGFGTLAALLSAASARLCGSRALFVLEGGYDLAALTASVIHSIRGCLSPEEFPFEERSPEDLNGYLRQVAAHHGGFWRCLSK